jgi:hypothetical protein
VRIIIFTSLFKPIYNIIFSFCSHKPHGDSPLLIKCSHNVSVICADQSYASDVIFVKKSKVGFIDIPASKVHSRRAATCEILITFPQNGSLDQQYLNEASSLRLHGNLDSGILYDFSILPDTIDSVFGQRTSDGWWVKALVEDKGKQYYLLSRNDGFTVRNTFISTDQINEVLLEGTGIPQLKAVVGTSIDTQSSEPQHLDSTTNIDTTATTLGGGIAATVAIVPKPPEDAKDSKITPAAPKRSGWFSFGSKN